MILNCTPEVLQATASSRQNLFFLLKMENEARLLTGSFKIRKIPLEKGHWCLITFFCCRLEDKLSKIILGLLYS